ncbi:MurR/RpiR family transcriptional regulator [Anaerotruncus sp. AF02-27]|uniref:MurR/RpiR family transcriptional regulator n=1 Tax=Anaerotruncus TaxID=244127 RepID=UPI000E48C02F|nr:MULTISPECIES: MurR/RpiR family transcriptional regulator [Anaerotruncus]RGX55779.1 MurR/RpiR family transcriptional regulator [Anaerotruncus sp. AF02-27]
MSEKNESSALLMKVRALRSSLSKTEEQVANYILEHPEEVIYLSVAGLAERSNASDATVIRTCRKLGMSGYQELKLTLAQAIVTPLQNIHEEISEGDPPDTIMDKVFQSTIHTIRYTHDVLRGKDLDAAADRIIASNRVAIFGLGNSHSIALDLQHKLLRVAVDATAYTDTHIQSIVATNLQKGDTVFAISHSGSSKDIVDASALAKSKGASIISLTNIGRSPLYDIADIRLCTASNETRYRIFALSSRIAQMAIIDTLHTMIALKKKDSSVTNFRAIERALEQKKY